MQMAGKVLPASVVSRAGTWSRCPSCCAIFLSCCHRSPSHCLGRSISAIPCSRGSGIVLPADTYLGGTSGQGGGTADLTPPANLSALVFLPISHTEWESVDGQVLTLYGPEGVTIRDAGSKTTFLLTPESITIATPEQFKVTVGSTVLTLTNGSWSLTGQSGTLADGRPAPARPLCMRAGSSCLPG